MASKRTQDHGDELAKKIDETDEMKLKMLQALEKVDKPSPDDILYPAELNAHLIEQLKIMTCENNELRKFVFTKEQEIKELNKTVADLNGRIHDIISGCGPAISSKSAGIISAKIAELCKTNRHLVAEVEGHKTKNATLERKIMQLDIMLKERDKLDVCVCKEEPIEPNTDELKELNEKLNLVNKKLYDTKNKNLALKNDILLATKILQEELGDKFTSLKELQNDVAGWKGRAQHILLLQSRISELEEKLNIKAAENSESRKKDPSVIIRDLECKRKREVDEAMKTLTACKEENVDLKKKLDGAKCRIRNLECDAMTNRQKMQTLMDKSKHDDMLINEQREQMKKLELHYSDVLKDNTAKINSLSNEVFESKKLLYNSDVKIEALRKQANEKASKIEDLRAHLLRYEECSLQSVFFTPMKTATDNEIKKLSDLVKSLNERLDIERQKWEELETQNRKLKERKRRAEKKLAALEEEIKSTSTKKNSRTSKALINNSEMLSGTQSATTQKRSSLFPTVKPSETLSSEQTEDDAYENLDKDDLKFKLELADEKLKMMEDRLRMLEEEKAEDYKNLTEMIQNSKQLFNDALCVLQKEKCMCEK